jgi:hypothetical protein
MVCGDVDNTLNCGEEDEDQRVRPSGWGTIAGLRRIGVRSLQASTFESVGSRLLVVES